VKTGNVLPSRTTTDHSCLGLLSTFFYPTDNFSKCQQRMRILPTLLCFFIGLCFSTGLGIADLRAQDLQPLQYNNPNLTVDLGVGLWAWPLPMDWDSDGDFDLVVSCPDKPYSGTYFFENPGGDKRFPIFKPGVRVGRGMKNLQVSFVEGVPHVLDSSTEFLDFRGRGFSEERQRSIYNSNSIHQSKGNQRFNVWSYVDYDGDGAQDVMIGVDDWGFYGWDDGYDARGRWKRGPLHGYVYILPNTGSTSQPNYAAAFRLKAGGEEINVYGNPMPNMADFDGDGDLDLLCGEFLDSFNYFENIGDRRRPQFAAGRQLSNADGRIHMHVQMITPTAIDWDQDGDVDIICGDEDGRVALIENTGTVADGLPVFQQPKYFQQQATDLKFGALVTPVSFDWDGDGDEDLVCGNTSGNIGWFENLDGGNPPQWAAPELLAADGQVIHIQAGPNGSIQGPAEAKWGYTTLSVADWNHDDLPDIVFNSIWGKVEWFQNVGTRGAPKLTAAKPIEVAWQGPVPKPSWTWWAPQPNELVTQWRTTPVVVDWNEDGLNDLVTLDHQGYLALFLRQRVESGLQLQPGQRVFRGSQYSNKHQASPSPDGWLRLNTNINGGSGRRKLCIVDWDGDGRRDILVNSANAHWLRNVSDDGQTWTFEANGPMAARVLAGHTTSPTTVDWNQDGIPELLLGAEDGRLYYLPRGP
jgi:hypothetical protein